jgi:hypothetical protein
MPLTAANVHPTGSDLHSVQYHLLRGDKEKAVEDAINGGDYAMALLVASMCSRETYFRAAKKYADQVLLTGSPLHTVAMLFCAQHEALLHVGGDAVCLRRSWRRHLAAIISNRTAGWDRVAVSLGDRLLALGETIPAHVCYMVCGCSLSPPVRQDSKMALLGCDVSSIDALLMTEDSIEAFCRTEAFEWAKRRGNRNAAIQSMQPFKLQYAMLLCDMGFEKEAKSYLASIRQCLGVDSHELDSVGEAQHHPFFSILTSDRKILVQLLVQFEQRLGLRSLENKFAGKADEMEDMNNDSSFITACTTHSDVTGQRKSQGKAKKPNHATGRSEKRKPARLVHTKLDDKRSIAEEIPPHVSPLASSPPQHDTMPAFAAAEQSPQDPAKPASAAPGSFPMNERRHASGSTMDSTAAASQGVSRDVKHDEQMTTPARSQQTDMQANSLKGKPSSAPKSAPANLQPHSPSKSKYTGIVVISQSSSALSANFSPLLVYTKGLSFPRLESRRKS